MVAAPASPCPQGPHPLGPTLTLLPLPALVSDIRHLPGEDPDLRHRGREGWPPLLRSSGERAELSHVEARARHVHSHPEAAKRPPRQSQHCLQHQRGVTSDPAGWC